MILDKFFKQKQYTKIEHFWVHGTQYYRDSIEKILTDNPYFNCSPILIKSEDRLMQKIFEKNTAYVPVKLEPEPKNIHDKNAIKVVHSFNNLLGYIPADECLHYKEIIQKYKYTAFAKIYSGNYKIVSGNGDVQVLESDYSIEVTLFIQE